MAIPAHNITTAERPTSFVAMDVVVVGRVVSRYRPPGRPHSRRDHRAADRQVTHELPLADFLPVVPHGPVAAADGSMVTRAAPSLQIIKVEVRKVNIHGLTH
ncbi:hypothetical protein [Streptomyces sp. NPDC047525]|uniref:hypothetical protein n=1 Tax=Streptomyces sp. NPDC047525 TaxID=3155264 RepID=UPI0033DEBB4C